MDQLPVGPLEKIVDLLSAEAATEDCEAASTPAREGLAGLHGASRHLRKATKQLTFVRVTKLPTVAQPAADFSAFPAVRTLIVHLNSDASCSLAGVEVLAQLRNLTAQAEQRINNARLTFLVERSQLINNARLTFPIDLSTLSQLTRVELLELTLLDIWGVHAEFDTSVVWKLKHLARLECPVADIEMRDLSSLSCLTYLDVGASDIEDMRPFTCLTGLVHLVMYDLNQYSGREVDLRPIASLTQLTNLSAGSVEGFDLSLVHGLSRLAYLMCSDSDVMDLTPISGLVGLEHLDILRSYDVLRLNESIPNCGLLSSHDDYSVVERFLPADAAVITQLRDPVDRVLSAYEFAVEVAARSLNRDRKPQLADPSKVNTRNVWPWSILVPFLEQDLHARAAQLAAAPQLAPTKDQPVDPYNNLLVMPLADFIEHPLAHELLHNGGALQVLGVTNYSHLPEAASIRSCASQDAASLAVLGQLAQKRVDGFVHVGLMDMLDESIASLAATLKMDLTGSSWTNVNAADQHGKPKTDADLLSPHPLWRTYRQCTYRTRRKNANRRATSFQHLKLADGRQVAFSRETRAHIDPALVARIRELNSLDMKLYEAGKALLQNRLEVQRQAGTLQAIPPLPEEDIPKKDEVRKRFQEATRRKRYPASEELRLR
ncbi:hypothetical protein WJX72_008465 [[Myrmecia] bisecta]|uniref:Uncharacterized protein n=1 Tax=[Myrmecia] bisecta TaxID=41462 RepID=A0AAW1PKG7_9CHLO